MIILRKPGMGRDSTRAIKEEMEHDVQIVRSDRLSRANWNAPFVFRWGCTIPINYNGPILNSTEAINRVSNKRDMRVILNEHNLCPRTWTSREDFLNSDYTDSVIVRPEHHSQGADLYLCRDANELEEALNQVGERYYINAYIPKVAEYRVFVAQGRVLSVARKTPADPASIAWNVSLGGRFDVVHFDDWPLRAVKCAIEAHTLSGLDFSAVDIMVDAEGNATCLELNTAPALDSGYRVQCISRWLDYCHAHIDGLHNVIPLTEARGGYRKFIHPAISDRAIV